MLYWWNSSRGMAIRCLRLHFLLSNGDKRGGWADCRGWRRGSAGGRKPGEGQRGLSSTECYLSERRRFKEKSLQQKWEKRWQSHNSEGGEFPSHLSFTSTVESWGNIKYRGLQGGKKQYISCFNSYGCVLRAFNTLKQFWRGCNSAHANGSVWVIIFKNSALKLTKELFLMQNIANAWDVWKPLFPTTSLSLLWFVHRATEWLVMNKKRFWWLNWAHPVSKLYYCQ